LITFVHKPGFFHISSCFIFIRLLHLQEFHLIALTRQSCKRRTLIFTISVHTSGSTYVHT